MNRKLCREASPFPACAKKVRTGARMSDPPASSPRNNEHNAAARCLFGKKCGIFAKAVTTFRAACFCSQISRKTITAGSCDVLRFILVLLLVLVLVLEDRAPFEDEDE